jgi:TolB-like protein/lipopolysaccharide biosynthesis regulator YciM
MINNPNKLSQLWQELKRRKVIRVITVYAASAFVILELVDILAPSLSLPDWTLNLVFILLCVGFIIAVILSWIYDIQPEGGIVKTVPAHEIIEGVPEKSSGINAWKIATILSVVVIIGLIIFNIFGRRGQGEDLVILDKSIAVLPFKSLSDDPEKQYLADGVMDAILLHLSKIEDLRVMDRTSVEQYRGTNKTTVTICQELDVTYLLEGSFQKFGDQARLIVQLIHPGLKDHIWAQEFNRDWKNIFTVQSEVAQTIAREIQAVITPEEKHLIEKIPTTSLTAYDFYQRGRAEYDQHRVGIARLETGNRDALERAEDFFQRALEYDSTFALAYCGLALVYYGKNFYEAYLDENFLDSMLILADIAVSFDDQLAEAYVVKGYYYTYRDKREQAVNELDKAIRFNPNNWNAYMGKGNIYITKDDIGRAIDNYNKAASLHRGPSLPDIYRKLALSFSYAGFKERSYYFAKERLALDGDSASYYKFAALSESDNGNFKQSIELGERIYSIDSMNILDYLLMGNNHSFIGQFEEAITYYQKAYDRRQSFDVPESLLFAIMIRLGQSYLIAGLEEEATYYLKRARDFIIEMDRLGRLYTTECENIHAQAGMYACLGEKEKAFDRLRLFNQKQHFPVWIVVQLKVDPLFNNIRDKPEFQQILRDVEAKYQIQHEEIRKWLEENDML